MMGRRTSEQGRLFYAFDLDAVVPGDHLLRGIDKFLDLSGLTVGKRSIGKCRSKTS